MLFTIFVSIVFISEIIITAVLIGRLIDLDKKANSISEFLTQVRPQIRDIAELVRKISEQFPEMAQIWKDKLLEKRDFFIRKFFESLVIGLLLKRINAKWFKKLRKSKVYKTAKTGLSLLGNMV